MKSFSVSKQFLFPIFRPSLSWLGFLLSAYKGSISSRGINLCFWDFVSVVLPRHDKLVYIGFVHTVPHSFNGRLDQSGFKPGVAI
jgi:hypothetical protein